MIHIGSGRRIRFCFFLTGLFVLCAPSAICEYLPTWRSIISFDHIICLHEELWYGSEHKDLNKNVTYCSVCSVWRMSRDMCTHMPSLVLLMNGPFVFPTYLSGLLLSRLKPLRYGFFLLPRQDPGNECLRACSFF